LKEAETEVEKVNLRLKLNHFGKYLFDFCQHSVFIMPFFTI